MTRGRGRPFTRAVAVAVALGLCAGACSSDAPSDDARPSTGASTTTTTTEAGTSTTDGPTDEQAEGTMGELTTGAIDDMDDGEVLAETYVAGFSLLVSMRTLQRFAGLIGVNQLFWQRALSGPETRTIVAPNRDTLYSIAVLDLRSGPVALTVPEITDRYHAYQFLDVWTESFAYVGTRATDGRAGTWVLTPPGWTGDLPEGVERIEATTPLVFLLGRFLVDDDADVAAVTAISDDVRLEPLAVFEGGEAPAPPPPLGEPLGTPQAIPTDASAYDELAAALAINEPSTPVQRHLFQRAATLGVEPGSRPSDDADRRPLLDEAAADGFARIDRGATGRAPGGQAPRGGWQAPGRVGSYGDDVRQRAVVARIGWGANVPEEAAYPITRLDADGESLSGEAGYRIRFESGELPPVDAFWSLTVYGDDLFFVPTPTGRYTIGDRTPGLALEPDGSLELVLSATEPPAGPDGRPANWLPVPEGPFVLMLRLYLPGPEVIDGTYELPDVERTA